MMPCFKSDQKPAMVRLWKTPDRDSCPPSGDDRPTKIEDMTMNRDFNPMPRLSSFDHNRGYAAFPDQRRPALPTDAPAMSLVTRCNPSRRVSQNLKATGSSVLDKLDLVVTLREEFKVSLAKRADDLLERYRVADAKSTTGALSH
jgi:hypothetical protein